MILLTVDKSKLTAELRTWTEDAARAQQLKSFQIGIGKAEGDKVTAGDNRTPEGIYFTQNHIDGKYLPVKYGPGAIPLDYPNPIDRIQGKTGSGIWLHGVDRDARVNEEKVTEGCVIFYNSDIKKLRGWLPPHQAVVVIASDAAQVNAAADVEAVRAASRAWVEAWRARDLDRYIALYAPDFKDQGRDLRGYREYKKNVFAGYKAMKVEMTDLRVVTHPKYAVSVMNQDFNGDNRFVSRGRKILYWTRAEGGAWKIIREEFERRRFEKLAYNPADIAYLR